ncbi:hypothetical protein R1sor_026462 [Riccia sorocarpa]|uniref:Uncharacterized protein n=1 Tax=Riccia sorocarpa TaxID=122646 RepID=A0ABD3GDI9_9MARC
MLEVIQYQDPQDVESQKESEHGQSHEESERESASRSSGEHEGVDEELDEVDDDDEDEDPESLDFADFAFEKFVVSWKLGKIPDVHGALGRPTNEKDVKVDRDFSQLSVNRYQEEFDLWDDLARSYNFPEKWLDGMLKFIPDKPDKETVVEETAVEDVSSSDEEEGSKKKKKPKKKSGFVEPLPSQVVTSLHRIYCAKHGEELPERLEPFAVLHLHKDISQYQLTLDEKLTCKLVFLDLTHPDLIPWEKQQFSSFLSIVRELTVATEFVIVSVMEFGQQLVNFSSTLNDMKDARALLECGA